MNILKYIFYPVALAFAVWILISAEHGNQLRATAAAMQSPAASAEMAWSELLEDLSFSLYGGAEERRRAYAEVSDQAYQWEQKSVNYGAALALAAVIQLMFVARQGRSRAKDLTWHLNLISMLAFFVGIAAPMLVVTAHAEVPLLGNVIFRFESKSIVTTITTLGKENNLLLAVLIALFSVALPIIKMAMLTSALAGRNNAVRNRIRATLHSIGKWSMADVFVVAVLVAYLASNTDEYSSAALGIGFYFFTAYCLLSLWAAHRFLHNPATATERET